MSRLPPTLTGSALLPLWFWPLWLCGQTIVVVEAELQRFGAKVRAARLARGWTQEELAHRTGLASVQVSRIERGKREVRLSTLLRLVRALDASPAVLLDGLT
jgi:DNA-binding Xre family transcriptional regulator